MVAEALRQWKLNHLPAENNFETIRQKWAEAVTANGPYYSLEEVFEPLKKKHTAGMGLRTGE